MDLIIIKAKLYLLKTDEGGRRLGIKSGYRPNHVFEYNNDKLMTFIGDIQFEGNEFLPLGEEKIVTVRFLKNEQLEKYITVRRKWFIHEGTRLVGKAEIVNVVTGIINTKEYY